LCYQIIKRGGEEETIMNLADWPDPHDAANKVSPSNHTSRILVQRPPHASFTRKQKL
jgi:hypothetical protein